jgi:modulator of FtsH protease
VVALVFKNKLIMNIHRVTSASLSANKILRQTYALLGLTLLFSALTAGVSAATHAWVNPVVSLVGYFGLLFAVSYNRHNLWGLPLTFALTGFMGYTLGPILGAYFAMGSVGYQMVWLALGGTASIFLVLSVIALTSKRDFSSWGSFLGIGALIAFILSLVGMLVHLPALYAAVSAIFVLISSGLIMVQTSEIIRGGETSYIMATVSLYVSIFNLFVSLLNLLGLFSQKD